MEYNIKVNQWVMTGKITLTEAEKTVLRLSAQGLTISEIEKLLHRSKSTIDTHRKSIFKKLKAKSMIEAIGYAQMYRLIWVGEIILDNRDYESRIGGVKDRNSE